MRPTTLPRFGDAPPLPAQLPAPSVGGVAAAPIAATSPVSKPSQTASSGFHSAMPPTLAFRTVSPAGHPLMMYVLHNGHRVLIEQAPNTEVVSLRTFIKTGSINENPVMNSPAYGNTGSPSGIAHLDEHCHFLTTQHFTRPYSWTDKVANYGSDFNASTSMEIIQHEMLCNKEDLPSMLALHGEAVLRPLYQPQLISKEKTNVINEIGERSRPAFAKIHNQLMKLMFDRPDFQTHGKVDDIKKTTVQDLLRFQQQWYRPSNMLTVLSGNIDVDKALPMIERQFGQAPPDVNPPVSQQIKLTLPVDKTRQSILRLPDLVQPLALAGFPAPPRSNARDRMAMTFLQVLLGAGPSALLQDTIKTKQRLATDVMVSYDPHQATGCLEIALDTPPGKELDAVQAMLQQIKALSSQPISPEKLKELKGRILNSYEAALERSEVRSLSMGEEASYQSLGYYLNFPKLVEMMTPQDLQRVAQQYLNPNRYALVLAYPEIGAAP